MEVIRATQTRGNEKGKETQRERINTPNTKTVMENREKKLVNLEYFLSDNVAITFIRKKKTFIPATKMMVT